MGGEVVNATQRQRSDEGGPAAAPSPTLDSAGGEELEAARRSGGSNLPVVSSYPLDPTGGVATVAHGQRSCSIHRLESSQCIELVFFIRGTSKDTKGFQSMKPALVTLVVLLLITTSTGLPRKLAADDGQQKADSQAKSEVNIDGKPSSGYGEHVCPRDMYPNCYQRMKKLTSPNHVG
uniref:Uncharacterized protein n=1 Tax=Oryza punctata TaxID=4537 RepID=A0A0E0KN04_ORYPU